MKGLDKVIGSPTLRYTSVCLSLCFVLVFCEFFGSAEMIFNCVGGLERSKKNPTVVRKLLAAGEGEVADRLGEPCSKDDIVVYQGATTPLPNGIPTYTVQILNVCISGCTISDIHVSCGWFSSARMINPKIFQRLAYDDCLVNDGEPLGPGGSLSFQYANSFQYPLNVAYVRCY